MFKNITAIINAIVAIREFLVYMLQSWRVYLQIISWRREIIETALT